MYTRFSHFGIEFLRENETVRETVLACRAKNRGQKSRDTNPLPKYGTFCPQKQKHKKHAKDKFSFLTY